MRDETRIHRILGLIESYWLQNPDLRFEQLLINLGLGKHFNKEDNVLLLELRSKMLQSGYKEYKDGNIIAICDADINPSNQLESEGIGYFNFNQDTNMFVYTLDDGIQYQARYVYINSIFRLYEYDKEKDVFKYLPDKEILRNCMTKEDERWINNMYFDDIDGLWKELIDKVRELE